MRVARGLGICQDLWNTSEFGDADLRVVAELRGCADAWSFRS